jgi:hypothetical protein
MRNHATEVGAVFVVLLACLLVAYVGLVLLAIWTFIASVTAIRYRLDALFRGVAGVARRGS